MMSEKRKRGRINWGSIVGWIIFILVIGGRSLFGLLQRVFTSVGPVPMNLSNLIPILIGGIVVLSVVVSAVRALGNMSRASGDVRLPPNMSLPRAPTAPSPPFGAAPGGMQRLPNTPPSPRAFTVPSSSMPPQRLSTPRFEPVINPLILVLSILGLLALGGAALFLFVQGGP